MSSYTAFPENPQDPWSVIGEALQWLAHTVLRLGLGVAIGLLVRASA